MYGVVYSVASIWRHPRLTRCPPRSEDGAAPACETPCLQPGLRGAVPWASASSAVPETCPHNATSALAKSAQRVLRQMLNRDALALQNENKRATITTAAVTRRVRPGGH